MPNNSKIIVQNDDSGQSILNYCYLKLSDIFSYKITFSRTCSALAFTCNI